MGSVFARGRKLYIKYKDPTGKWVQASTDFFVGDEKKAKKLVSEIEEQVRAGVPLDSAALGPLTVRRYAKRWLQDRSRLGLTSFDDDKSRLETHVLPSLGDLRLHEVRPRHVRDFVLELRCKKSARNELLAPRTVRNIYGVVHCMFHDAVVDEVIDANPCVLKKGVLPPKVDKDPTWRASAIFTREEVEQIISDERIPLDRRVFYAMEFFVGGTRFGESSALQWRFYDPTIKPLGRVLVAFSYDTKARKVKGTKTGITREVPAHPTVAKILAAWKLGGWEQMMGHAPEPDDLIVPSREGRNRNVNHGLKRFHEDLDRLGLRRRRQHDLRRSFISLAQADGALPHILQLVTHGPRGDIFSQYTTLPWAAICAEVAKLKVSLLEGAIIALPKSTNLHSVDSELGAVLGASDEETLTGQEKSPKVQDLQASLRLRGGRDLNPRPPA